MANSNPPPNGKKTLCPCNKTNTMRALMFLNFHTVDFKYIRIRERDCYRPTFNHITNHAPSYGDCGRWCIENRECGAFTTRGNGNSCWFKRGSCDRFLRHDRHVSIYIPKGNNMNFNRVFHKLDEICNNANIRIRGFTT